MTAPRATTDDATFASVWPRCRNSNRAAPRRAARPIRNLDALLDPRQQARFRVFEEQSSAASSS